MKIKLSLAIVVVLAMTSCKKDKTSFRRFPLIKEYVQNIPNVGTLKSDYSYENERVHTEMSSASPVEYEYYDDKVIANVRNSNGSFWYRETYELDNNGYINKKYQSGADYISYYKVRQDGFIESEYYLSGNGNNELKYHYDKMGLLDTTFRYINGVLSATLVYIEYDLDREYTADNENFGKSFLGRKFIHPPLKFKTVNTNLQVIGQGASTYTYDGEGRIIKDVRTINNSIDHTYTYVYY